MAGREVRGNCENCIDKNRSALLGLARRYVAIDHWLKNGEHRMIGDYSLMAIHALTRRIDTRRSVYDVRGPLFKADSNLEQDEFDLFQVKFSINSNTLTSDHIGILREVAQKRQVAYDTFLNKGKSYWDRQAQRAKPFLDQLANPQRSIVPQKKDELSQVYWFDQGAFILAKTALGRCEGPWFRMCPYGEKFGRFHVPIPRKES